MIRGMYGFSERNESPPCRSVAFIVIFFYRKPRTNVVIPFLVTSQSLLAFFVVNIILLTMDPGTLEPIFECHCDVPSIYRLITSPQSNSSIQSSVSSKKKVKWSMQPKTGI